MIAYLFFPSRPPDLANASKVLITGMSWPSAVAMKPDFRILARRNSSDGTALIDEVIAVVTVVGSIATGLVDFIFNIIEQSAENLTVSY